MSDVTDDDAPATKRDLRKLEEKLDATKAELIDVISRETSRAVKSTEENMRRWSGALLDKHDSDVTATNANVATLRDELDAHRDDTKVHVSPAPRRRSRG